ncbi:MAG: hypothetical protein NTZ80_00290 [Patescibacteria group bacterium]|nr:hypothetical protein [Patescibacteria group bacterium]
MADINKVCRQNPSHQFVITDEDQTFYEKIGVPHPTLCPDCRQQRRLAFRNERALYHRKCDLSGKQIISMYPLDKSFPVYAPDQWWSDKWNALEHGRDFNFDKPFFTQFSELMGNVPRMALGLVNVENSDYCNYTGDLKNCYLCFGSIFAEDCYYGSPYYCKDCVDVLVTRDSQFCYECVDCEKLYECLFCQDCYNSNGLLYCYDCQGCNNCICCAGLRKASYCIFNNQLSKDEYEKQKSFLGANHGDLQKIKVSFEKVKASVIRKFAIQQLCENSTGSYLTECQNVQESFYVRRARDSKYLMQTIDIKDSYDVNFMEESELIYDSFGAYRNYHNSFCNTVYESSNMLYCDWCMNSCSDCFGCIGLKHNQYCILNKQYQKDQYEALLPQIVERLKKSSEYGEFFPFSVSPFGYNETVAHEYFPLAEEEAMSSLGAKWKDDDIDNHYQGPKVIIPESAKDVSDEIIKQILTCDSCAKNYRLIPQELKFYRQMNIPVPRDCPNCRHKARLALRNPRHLWDRTCMKCGVGIKTTYAPERKEKVYCEKCYNESVY